MKSEKETIYDYAAELKLLALKEELECTLSLAAEENWNHGRNPVLYGNPGTERRILLRL